MTENLLREEIAELGKSLYDRGLAHGSAGNISVKLADGNWLLTPTNSCLGRLDPAKISRLDGGGRLVSGDPPSKAVDLIIGLTSDAGGTINGAFNWIDHPLQAPIPSWDKPSDARPWIADR